MRVLDVKICAQKVYLDGLLARTYESYAESTFDTLGVEATGVSTVMLKSIELLPDEWISLLEVRGFLSVNQGSR